MASSLLRSYNLACSNQSAFVHWTRLLSSDSLVEFKPGEIGIVSGIPEENLHRRVINYSPARTASQQGSGKVGKWKINFLSTHKWENPLMGWTSTGDPYANVGDAALSFDSAEAAMMFAEKHDWNRQFMPESDRQQLPFLRTLLQVEKRQRPILKPKSYADNFKWKGPPKTEEI